jgi:hypothetical protein
MTPRTEFEAATSYMKSRATGFSKDRVSELFHFLARTVEHNLNATTIYAHNVDKTV